MSEDEEEYSAYMTYQSNSSNTWALFSGFTFTAITILLTQLPDPSQITSQITLFILAVMLDIFLYELIGVHLALLNCVRIGPPLPDMWNMNWNRKTQLLLNYIGWLLLGMSIVLMYLLWNLLYLALASGVVWVLLIVFAHFTWIKPLSESRHGLMRPIRK